MVRRFPNIDTVVIKEKENRKTSFLLFLYHFCVKVGEPRALVYSWGMAGGKKESRKEKKEKEKRRKVECKETQQRRKGVRRERSIEKGSKRIKMKDKDKEIKNGRKGKM